MTRDFAMTLLPTPTPAIRTREQLEVVLENIAQLRRERDELRLAQDNEIAAVRQRHRAPLAEIDAYLDLETTWAEAWSRENSGAFATDRSLSCAHATIGFQAAPPRIERASRRWTWSRIAATLAGLDWGKRYLRIPAPEVDKDAILADLPRLSAEDLRSAGIRIAQGERFYITTHTETEAPWQEAA
jgi:phage host-nuclease inhibitor protein Gam